jgi:hypothetical protein
MKEVDENITGSVHPITFRAIETFKQEFYNTSDFDEFVREWVLKIERKEAQKYLLMEFIGFFEQESNNFNGDVEYHINDMMKLLKNKLKEVENGL